MKKKWVKITLGVAGALLVFAVVFSITNSVYPLALGLHNQVFSSDGLAIRGYDPVAYFQDGAAQEGREEFSLDWKRARWLFASREHLAAFQTDPARYAPQFGGYCSFAVSKGFTASVDPLVWHIKDGRLYLFDSEDIKTDWLAGLDTGIIQDGLETWR